jgi:hypothetical protein
MKALDQRQGFIVGLGEGIYHAWSQKEALSLDQMIDLEASGEAGGLELAQALVAAFHTSHALGRSEARQGVLLALEAHLEVLNDKSAFTDWTHPFHCGNRDGIAFAITLVKTVLPQ